jgi:predicted HD superfamily hydrolase involved in NAD metabolism
MYKPHSMEMTLELVLPKAEEIKRFMREKLSEGRRDHCNRVMRIMGEVAEVLKLDGRRAKLAGMFHDIAREMPLEDQIKLIRKHHPKTLIELPEKKWSSPSLHGPAGACLLEHEFGVTDASILNAVYNHAGSFSGMDQLTAVLHVSDLAEPAAPFPGQEKLKTLLLQGRVFEAVLIAEAWSLEYLDHMKIPVPLPLADRVARNHALMRKLNRLTPDFFSRT